LKDLSGLLFEYTLIWQLIPLAIIAGLLGGLFSIILVFLIDKFTFNTAKKILATSLIIGIIVGLFNYFSEFLISGSGKQEVMFMLDSQSLGVEFILMKYFSVLTSVTSAIPGGLFLPTISIGMGIGSEASNLMPLFEPQVVMIMATIAYLAGTIRTPLTATFVVLEMTSTMHLILPALMVAFIANYVSRLIKKQPLYETMADNYKKITNP
jgi:H+/Cl- antiporter ClcA